MAEGGNLILEFFKISFGKSPIMRCPITPGHDDDAVGFILAFFKCDSATSEEDKGKIAD